MVKMENVLTRIAIIPRGEDPNYIYSFETLNVLNIEVDQYSHHRFMNIGTEFEFNDERYRVYDITSTISDVTHIMEQELPGGISDAIDMPLNFNFEVNYLVERI